jgi:predicted anti-sigma-YlaC factor YlaD
MRITWNVISDLLPGYLANEASEDTVRLIEEFLAENPQYRQIVDRERADLASDENTLRRAARHELPPDHEMATLAQARARMERKSWLLALALMMTIFPLSFEVQGGRLTFLMIRDAPPLGMLCWLAAIVFWALYLRTRRGLRSATGL